MGNGENHAGESVTVRGSLAHDGADGGGVGRAEAAAEGEGEQLFREGGGEQIRAREQGLLQASHAGEGRTPPQGATSVDRTMVLRGAPAADRIEMFQREADRVHHVVAAGAGGVRAVLGKAFADGQGGGDDLVIEGGDVGGRRGRGRTGEVGEDPVAPNHGGGTGGVGGDREDAAVAQQAPALPGGIAGEADAAEVAAEDVRDAVVPGEAFVEERVVRREEIRHGAVLTQDALHKELRLAAHRLAEVVVEINEAPGVGGGGGEGAEVKPLRGEVGHEIRGARVGEHPPNLRGEAGGGGEIPAFGGGEQRLVGEAAPEKEREPGGECEAVDRVGGAGRQVRGLGFHPEEEAGVHQQGGERGLDPGLEAALAGAGLAEELQRAAEIVVRDGLAVGRAGEPGEDRAGPGLGGGGGGLRAIAGGAEDPAAAGGVAAGPGIEGAGDRDLEHRGRRARVAVHIEAGDERGAFRFEHGGGGAGESHGQFAPAGGDREAEAQVLVDRFGVFVGSGRFDRGDGDAGAVEEDLDLVGAAEALDLLVAVALEADLHLVLTLLRKQVGDQNPAAGAEGQAGHVVLLRDVGPDAERVSGGGLAGAADGEAGDFLGGGDVAVEEGGREIADGDVVEAVARFVIGEEVGGVELDGEQVADRVLVLGAVEAAEGGGAAGVGAGAGGGVEVRGEGGDDALVSCFIGPGLAVRGHLAVVEFAEDLFPEGGMGGGVAGVEGLEVELAFF